MKEYLAGFEEHLDKGELLPTHIILSVFVEAAEQSSGSIMWRVKGQVKLQCK